MIRLSAKEVSSLQKKTRKKEAKPKNAVKTIQTNSEILACEKKLPRQPRIQYGLEELRVEVNLEPVPKERARTFIDKKMLVNAFVRSGGDTRKFAALVSNNIMKTVTPENTRSFEAAIALFALQALNSMKLTPFTQPVEMEIDFRFTGDPQTWPTSQADGDLDNLEKAVLDGLSPVWVDDRLVVRKTSLKRCASKPGISITIRLAKPEFDSFVLE